MPKLPRGETLKGHIGPASFDGDGLGRVVKNALCQAGSREDGELALSEALTRAQLQAIPNSAGHLTAFVLGPLFEAVTEQSGTEVARRMIAILKPVLRKRSELELGEAPDSSPAKPTVLIVDDDIVVRAQLLSILNSNGYAAVSAPDPNVALAMSVRCRPDLIISDMGMGRAKDSQLAALLKVAFHEAAPPIIILTHGEPQQDPASGICMLKKPIDRDALLGVIAPLLQRCSVPPN